MIFFFVLVVAGCLAWGLGLIGLKNNELKSDNINSNDQASENIVQKEKSQIENTNTTVNNTSEVTLTMSEI